MHMQYVYIAPTTHTHTTSYFVLQDRILSYKTKHKTKKALGNLTHPTTNPITQDKKTRQTPKPFNMLSPPKEK